jgi:hypothetical protein
MWTLLLLLPPQVYPVIVGFAPSGPGGGPGPPSGHDDDCSATPWLYPSRNAHVDRLTCHSDLGSPEYQAWLLKALGAFYDLFGEYCGGFAFDGVFLGEPKTNHTGYAQWRGWANVRHQHFSILRPRCFSVAPSATNRTPSLPCRCWRG